MQIVERMREHRAARAKLVHHTNVRFDDALMERIEKVAQQIEEHVGIQVSRHDVIRVIIEVGLDDLDGRPRAA